MVLLQSTSSYNFFRKKKHLCLIITFGCKCLSIKETVEHYGLSFILLLLCSHRVLHTENCPLKSPYRAACSAATPKHLGDHTLSSQWETESRHQMLSCEQLVHGSITTGGETLETPREGSGTEPSRPRRIVIMS